MPEDKKPGSKPTHRVYATKPYKSADGEDRTLWTRLGSAWPTKSGNGFRLKLDALPMSGELLVLDITETPADDTAH